MKEDYEREIKDRITMEIEHRLDGFWRGVSGLASGISNAIWPLHHKTEREKEMIMPKAMEEWQKTIDPNDPNKETRHVQFWRVELKKYQKPFDDKLEELRRFQAELGGIGHQARLVFCAVCREKPVQLHYGNNDKQVSSEVVCDDCFGKASGEVLHTTDEGWKNIRYAEKKCRSCGKIIVKFALGNVVSLKAQNGVSSADE